MGTRWSVQCVVIGIASSCPMEGFPAPMIAAGKSFTVLAITGALRLAQSCLRPASADKLRKGLETMRKAFTRLGQLPGDWGVSTFWAGMTAAALVIVAFFGIPPLTAQSVESSTFLNTVVPNPNGVYIGAYPFSPDSDLESAE